MADSYECEKRAYLVIGNLTVNGFLNMCGDDVGYPIQLYVTGNLKAKNISIAKYIVANIIGGISVKGYVLPHKSAFSSEVAYTKAEGINGWAAQQGFYVYRGKRLLLAGDWLGLFRKEEHYKLVRIKIDLPNTLDTEWQIDIKKSRDRILKSIEIMIDNYLKNTMDFILRHYV